MKDNILKISAFLIYINTFAYSDFKMNYYVIINSKIKRENNSKHIEFENQLRLYNSDTFYKIESVNYYYIDKNIFQKSFKLVLNQEKIPSDKITKIENKNNNLNYVEQFHYTKKKKGKYIIRKNLICVASDSSYISVIELINKGDF